MRKLLFFSLCILFVWSACRTQLKRTFLAKEDIVFEEAVKANPRGLKSKNASRDPQSYVPDSTALEEFPMRLIRVNFHFVNNHDSTQNFNGYKAVEFAKHALKTANQKVAKNIAPWLPREVDIPGLPKQYQYVLTPRSDDPTDTGVYCHYDDQLYFFVNKGRNRNNSSRSVIKKYAVQKDTILNIFLMPHHPDSVRSKTYKPHQAGIALGSSIKISGVFNTKKAKPWKISGVLNHEIGHVLGLSHAWGYDNCDDTPIHPNCWNVSKTPPCDTMASNNVMDYNAQQNAWTPCQIGTIQRNFAKLRSKQRKLLIKNWCALDERKTIYIRDTRHWQGAKDLQGHIIIDGGGSLEISCRVALAKGAKIIVRPNGKLILNNAHLHNDCGELWEGIEIEKEGDRKGTIVFVGVPKLENIRHDVLGVIGKGKL